MQDLTPEGQRLVNDLSQRSGFSPDAVLTMLRAVSAGYGTQAQFNHPEFGGMGQWSQGGMIMIGDMFNQNLKYRVSSLCDEISGLLRNQPLFAAPASSQSQSQGSSWSGQSQGSGFSGRGLQPVRAERRFGRLVARRTGVAGLHRRAERHALRLFSRRRAASRSEIGGQTRVYDTARPQYQRLLAAAKRGSIG